MCAITVHVVYMTKNGLRQKHETGNLYLSCFQHFSFLQKGIFSDIDFTGNIVWILILKNQEYLVVWYQAELEIQL